MNVSRNHRQRGISLVEMIITVAVIGVVAAIAFPSIGNVVGNSRETVVENVVETLNKATREFGHAQWDLALAADPSSADDEFAVLRTLQWREGGTDPNQFELHPKGPFMRRDWIPSSSSSSEDYRIEWTGRAWRMIEPGEAGTGLRVAFDGSDLGTSYIHPDDFKPVGYP